MISLASSVTAAYLRIADDPPVDVDPSTGKGPEWGKASPVGLLVILLLAVATFFLLRSMTRRLKRVQDGLQEPPTALAGVPEASDRSDAIPDPASSGQHQAQRSDAPPG